MKRLGCNKELSYGHAYFTSQQVTDMIFATKKEERSEKSLVAPKPMLLYEFLKHHFLQERPLLSSKDVIQEKKSYIIWKMLCNGENPEKRLNYEKQQALLQINVNCQFVIWVIKVGSPNKPILYRKDLSRGKGYVVENRHVISSRFLIYLSVGNKKEIGENNRKEQRKIGKYFP